MKGKIISHYRIIEKLGEGGMGIVYKAEDTKLKRTVALKFLPPDLVSNPEAKERLKREAQAAAALEHPNICNIHEIDETEDRRLFIAMAYYRGETLHLKMDKGPVPAAEAIDLTIQIAAGLGKAHSQGIIHRDVKPQNIIIEEEGRVKILDFGLAKLKGQSRLTRTGSTMCTAAYISPEQVQGEEVDPRSDLWSLGVILYEMLSGELPFSGDNIHSMLYAIAGKDYPPIRSHNADIPMELAQVIDRLLTKERDKRYQNSAALIADLRAVKRESDTGIGLTRKELSGITKYRRRPSLLLTAGIVLAVLILTVGAYIIFNGQPGEKGKPAGRWVNSVAVLPFTDLSPNKDQEYFCDGMVDDIITKLSHIRELKVISRTSVMRYKQTRKPLSEIGAELGVATVLEGSIRKEEERIRVNAKLIDLDDESYLWTDTFDRKLESIFDMQDEVSQAIAEALHVKLAPGEIDAMKKRRQKNVEAYECYLKGKYFISSKYMLSGQDRDFEAGVKMFEKAIAIDPDYALAYAGFVWAYEHRYLYYSHDKNDRAMVLTSGEKAYRLDPRSAETNTAMAYVYFIKGSLEKAHRHFKTALEINPNVSEIIYIVGDFYLFTGLCEQGIKFYLRSLEIDPFYTAAINELAMCYIYLGEYEKAAVRYGRMFEISPEAVIFAHPYAELLVRMKKYEAAAGLLAKLEQYAPGNPKTLFIKALLLAAKGKGEEALAIYGKEDFDGLKIYALLGMKAEACRVIEKLKKEKYDFIYSYMVNDNFLKNLSGESCFDELLQETKQVHEYLVATYGNL